MQLPAASQLMHELGCCPFRDVLWRWVRQRTPDQNQTGGVSHYQGFLDPMIYSFKFHFTLARMSWSTKRTFSTTAGLCVWMRWPSFTCVRQRNKTDPSSAN